MSMWALTYQQGVLKRYHSGKRFSEFLVTRWRQKSTGMDMEQNYAISLYVYSALWCSLVTIMNILVRLFCTPLPAAPRGGNWFPVPP